MEDTYTVDVRGKLVEFPTSVPPEEAEKIIAQELPPSGEEVREMIAMDPEYELTLDDYKVYEDWQKSRTLSSKFDEGLEMIPGVIDHLGTVLGDGIVGAFTSSPLKAPANVVEGFAQGTKGLWQMLAHSENPDAVMFQMKDFVFGDGTVESRFKQTKKAIEFRKGLDRNMTGEETVLLPKGWVDNRVVQATALVADPTVLSGFLTGGSTTVAGLGGKLGRIGKIAELGNVAAQKATQKALHATGTGLRVAAAPVTKSIEVAGKGIEAMTGLPPKHIHTGAVAAGGAGIVNPATATAGAVILGAEGAELLGDALQRVSKGVAGQPSRVGALAAVAADTTAPQSVRTFARAAQLMGGDLALDLSLRGATGAATGAVVGGLIGYGYDDVQGGVAGAGAGSFLGGAGAGFFRSIEHGLGRVKVDGQRADAQRWISSIENPKHQERAAAASAIMEAQIPGSSALLADADIAMRAIGGQLRFIDEATTQRIGGQKGAQGFFQERGIGDAPTMFLNLEAFGRTTPAHEAVHALLKTVAGGEQLAAARDILFGTISPEGKVNQDGVIAPDSVRAFAEKYRDRMKGEARDVWDGYIQDAFNENLELTQRLAAQREIADEFTAYYGGYASFSKGLFGKVRYNDSLMVGKADTAIGVALKNARRFFEGRTRRQLKMDFTGESIESPFASAKNPGMKRFVQEVMAGSRDAQAEGNAAIIRYNMRNAKPANMQALADAGFASAFVRDASGKVIRQRTVGEERVQLRAQFNAIRDALVNNGIDPDSRLLPNDDGTQSFNLGEIVASLDAPRQAAMMTALERFLGPSHRRFISQIASQMTSRNKAEFGMTYWSATTRSKRDSAVYASLGASERNVVPYSIEVSAEGGVYVRALDMNAIQKRFEKAWQKAGRKVYGKGERGKALSEFNDYLDNLTQDNPTPSADLKVGGLRLGEEKRNFFYEVLGTVPSEVNRPPMDRAPRPGYVPEHGTDKVFKSFRVDRMAKLDMTGKSLSFTEDGTYRRSQANFQPEDRNFQPTDSTAYLKVVDDALDAPSKDLFVDTDPYEGGKVRSIAKMFAETMSGVRKLRPSKTGFQKAGDRIVALLDRAMYEFPNFASWYEGKIKEAMSVFTELDPDLVRPENKSALTLLLAVTSNGAKVFEQTVDAWEIYKHYKQTGKVSSFSGGRGSSRAEAIRTHLRMIDDFSNYLGGMDKVGEFMSRKGTVAELRKALVEDLGFTKKEAGKLTTGELIDEVVPFSLVFGAKLGSFFNNLNGDFSTVTMDRWFMRTFGRAMGTQLEKAVDARKRALTRFKDALEDYDGSILARAGTRKSDSIQVKNYRIWKFFTEAQNRKNLTAKENEIRKAANALIKVGDGFTLREAPKSGAERRWIRNVMLDAIRKFNEKTGKNLNPAEAQALLWYYEKLIHETFGSRQDDSSPDYAAAARRVYAKERGREAATPSPENSSGIERRRDGRRGAAFGSDPAQAHQGRGESFQPSELTPAEKQSNLILPYERPQDSYPASRTRIDSDTGGLRFHRGIHWTQRDHRFGAAVEVKDASFYTEGGTALFAADDGLAGAAVTQGGDLVSVFRHPESEHGAGEVIRDASLLSSTLDAFDIGGFLPDRYRAFGFKPAARVKWNDDYAPPNWPYDIAGRPDVVLMFRDPVERFPEAFPEELTYAEFKNKVPVFDSWDEAYAKQQEWKAKVKEAGGYPDYVRFQPSDADYMKAVKGGDMRAAEDMVKAEAKAAGFNVDMPLWHRTWSEFNAFKHSDDVQTWETGDRKRTLRGASGKAFWFGTQPTKEATPANHNWKRDAKERMIPVYTDAKNPLVIDVDTKEWAVEVFGEGMKDFPWMMTDEAVANVQADGYDSVHLYYGSRTAADGLPNEVILFDPNQAKSADPVTFDDEGNPIPVSERFNKATNDIRFQPSDADYMKAVEGGDMEAAQQMVDAAADFAGYYSGWAEHHGTNAKPFNKFSSPYSEFWFSADRDIAESFGRRVVSAYLDTENPLVLEAGGTDKYSIRYRGETYAIDDLVPIAKRNGHDSLVVADVVDSPSSPVPHRVTVVFDPNQIKSADPVTYDDAGNVIPLSERFNEATDDIRFMPGDDALRELPFKDWSEGSVVRDDDGNMKRVYRGEHGNGDPGRLHTRSTAITFSSLPESASGYATRPNNTQDGAAKNPRVTPAYLRIAKPWINSPDDPFVDLATIEKVSGRETTLGIIERHSSDIENTGAWEEFSETHDVESVSDAMKKGLTDEVIQDLYLLAFPVLDDNAFVASLVAEGYDGAIHAGYGDGPIGEVEYKIFDPAQARSALDTGHRFQPGDDMGQIPGDAGPVERSVPRPVLSGPKRNVPTAKEALSWLTPDKQKKGRAVGKAKEGSRVGLRIDIPAYQKSNFEVYTVSVHDHSKNPRSKAGPIIGYEPYAYVEGPLEFVVNEKFAKRIKTGEVAKNTIAVVEGNWKVRKTVPRDIATWTQVGMNPKRHSYFYDRKTFKPVVGGDAAFSIGGTVFVKNAIFGDADSFLFQPSDGRTGRVPVSKAKAKAQTLRHVESRPIPAALRDYRRGARAGIQGARQLSRN